MIGLVSSLIALLVILPVLLLSLPFWIVTIIQNGIYTLVRSIRPIPSSWDALIQYHPVIGWKPKPNMKTYAKGTREHIYELTTDEDGWRKGKNGIADNDVYVFGDSFAFGFGANDDEFFANLLLRPRIKAIGANGYNMVQELILMEKYAPLFKNKTVVWFIYHGNDLYENMTPNMRQYRMPFIREINGTAECEIVTSHVNPSYWSINTKLDYYGKLAEICSDTPLSKRAFAACDYLIQRGKEICDRVNARLCIISLPDIIQIDTTRVVELAEKTYKNNSFDPDLPDKKLKRICQNHSVAFYTLKEYLTPDHFINKDVHWNREGNRRVAQLIKDIYEK